MLKYKVGDLCLAAIGAEVNVIAHQANCFCRMKSGVAKRISELFPDAVTADLQTIQGDRDKLGRWTLGIGQTIFGHNIWIFNLYGQYNYGYDTSQYTDYAHLERALRRMAERMYLQRDKVKIGLPKIGAGLGGGDWEIISRIIEKELKAFDVTIYVLNTNEIPLQTERAA